MLEESLRDYNSDPSTSLMMMRDLALVDDVIYHTLRIARVLNMVGW